MNLAIKIIWTVVRTALSLALLTMSIIAFSKTYSTTSQEKRAILLVSSTLPVSNGHGDVRSYPVVLIEDLNHTIRSLSVGGLYWGEQFKQGEYILVRYNPAIPTGIRLDSWTSNAMIWAFPIATGLLGLLVLPTIKQFQKDPSKPAKRVESRHPIELEEIENESNLPTLH